MPMTHISDSVVRFHRRYAIFSMTVLILFVMVFIVLVINQHALTTAHEKKMLENNFNQAVSHLDSLLAAVTMRVESLKISAEADMNESRQCNQLISCRAFASLSQDASQASYNLDTPKPPLRKENIGNLTGIGQLDKGTHDFFRELHMALRLNPHFDAIADSLENAAWIYYTSASEFINAYPWVASADFKFSREFYTHGFYSLGLPENNPQRKWFWTEVYLDEYGKGLMTTCAAPIYDGDRFLGTVAIDLTVDFLNTAVKSFRPESGVMFVINKHDQLVAHPFMITSSDRRTKTLQEALAASGWGKHPLPDGIPDRSAVEIENHLFLESHLSNAPWRVFYMESKRSAWQRFAGNVGVKELAIVLLIPVFIVLMLVITNLYFIRPSQQFARFIVARSQRRPFSLNNKVPRAWQPWFEAIEKTFDENDEMACEIQRQKDVLENRVQTRTAELADTNRQLSKEIQERKQIEASLRDSEERYRRIFNNILDTYFEMGLDGHILEISPSIERHLGFEREALIGQSICGLFHDPDQMNQVIDKLQTQGHLSDIQLLMQDKRGEYLPCSLNMVIAHDTNGASAKIIGSIRDIHYRKQVEAEKKQLEARLQRMEKMEALGTLAGGVAHDLNNILGGIISYPELLLLELDKGSPLRNSIQTIKRAGEKAAAIVQDMLTLARRGIAVLDTININRVIDDYLKSPEFIQLQSIYPGIRFEVRLDHDLLPISGSPVHLSKTIMNLVNNAAEAIPRNGTVAITTTNQYVDRPIKGYDKVEQGDYVVVTVADDGQGIQPEDVDKVFEPFYTKKKMGRSGTGLGMAVVWGTVKDHGGYIDVHSVPDQGTTITLYFRATRERIREASEEVSLAAYRGDETILVVDDVAEQRELARSMLSPLGYTVSTVSSGEAAVAFLRDQLVDLVILDMIMDPGMDGLDTYIEILKLHPDQKAIVTSGYSETERVHETQRLGAGAYVRKPYLMSHIARAVRGELDK